MEPLANFVLFILGLAAFALVLGVLKSANNKRAGTGEWAEFGANPTRERIAHVRLSRDLYQSGLTAIVDGRPGEAQTLWKRSAEMGHLPAYTGLGIVEILEGRSWGTTAYWRRASEGGDVAAQILDEIKKDEAVRKLEQKPPPPITVIEFAWAYLRAQNLRELDSINTVIGTALHHGKRDFADEWARIRDFAA